MPKPRVRISDLIREKYITPGSKIKWSGQANKHGIINEDGTISPHNFDTTITQYQSPTDFCNSVRAQFNPSRKGNISGPNESFIISENGEVRLLVDICNEYRNSKGMEEVKTTKRKCQHLSRKEVKKIRENMNNIDNARNIIINQMTIEDLSSKMDTFKEFVNEKIMNVENRIEDLSTKLHTNEEFHLQRSENVLLKSRASVNEIPIIKSSNGKYPSERKKKDYSKMDHNDIFSGLSFDCCIRFIKENEGKIPNICYLEGPEIVTSKYLINRLGNMEFKMVIANNTPDAKKIQEKITDVILERKLRCSVDVHYIEFYQFLGTLEACLAKPMVGLWLDSQKTFDSIIKWFDQSLRNNFFYESGSAIGITWCSSRVHASAASGSNDIIECQRKICDLVSQHGWKLDIKESDKYDKKRMMFLFGIISK
jgi:hypothetical protein